MFGFEGPADTLGPRGELTYEMKRPPSGYFLDILYIDDEMRASRGNAGSLVITARA